MSSNRIPRRAVLATLGVASVAGCLGEKRKRLLSDRTQSTTGPDGDWTVIVEENWEQFDSDRWGVGFIDRDEWIPDDDATVSSEHVFVEGGQCVLEVESDGTGPSGCYQGVINSSVGGESHHPSVGIPIDPSPGQYVEARLKLPGRTGVLPAFWMHPANTNWPPEIDIVELFQRGDEPETERRLLNVDVHWSASGDPNDRGTHKHAPSSIDTGIDLTDSFNRYGCAWFEDRVEWYFNGQQVATRSSPPAMIESLTASTARPFGLVLSNHVNRIGQADLTRAWSEQLVIDWITISEQSS